MKKRILTILGISASILSFGQISEGGLPTTFSKVIQGETPTYDNNYQIIELSEPDMIPIYAEDAVNGEKGNAYRVSINVPLNLSITNSGTWETLENGDKIWRLGIKMPKAKALGLYFSEGVSIPVGGKLHAYNSNHAQFVGAYTSKTPNFKSMEMIEGELLTLEYYMPAGSSELPIIKISDLAYFYRGVGDRLTIFSESTKSIEEQTKAQSCEVDVACSEISGWETQRDAVVRYTFVSGGSTYLCSGAMVNNTANDCKPYFLTANHCGEPTSNAAISNHTFYFNYQRPTCSPNNTTAYTGALSQTMSGGTLKASSALGNQPAGNSNEVDGSDFVLIEMNSTVPSSYNPYFAGWDRATSASTSGVGIHHPAGDEKKISTYSASLSSATYNGGWSGAHWAVSWIATTNGHGVTEGGSSGSPIFNQNGLIVGHLSGGSSFCSTPTASDLYGKFLKAWDQEGTNANQQLKPWLDPGNTNSTTLAGTYAPCNGTGGGATGYCDAASTTGTCDEFISNVKLNTIDNASVCTNYSNFTTQSTSLVQNATYTVIVEPSYGTTVGGAYTDDEIAVWIDWNGDEDFADNGERVGYTLISATSLNTSYSFTVPSNAVLGTTRMRVRISYSASDGAIVPCGDTQWGEVEDYTIVITEPQSVEENGLNNISIYPNPTNNSVFVDLSNVTTDVSSIELRDVTGRIIASQINPNGTIKFNLSAESAGVYFVTIRTENGTLTKKVIRF